MEPPPTKATLRPFLEGDPPDALRCIDCAHKSRAQFEEWIDCDEGLHCDGSIEVFARNEGSVPIELEAFVGGEAECLDAEEFIVDVRFEPVRRLDDDGGK